MSITTKCGLGVAAALIVCISAACSGSKKPEATSQTTQPTTAQTTQAPTSSTTAPPPMQQALIADVSESELSQFFSSMPDGRDLPAGSGTVMQGATVYAAQCASCHGAKLEGGIGPKLIGGRGTLAATPGNPPVKTIESYWPYATTVFDYIKRAMPFPMPGSLSNDDAYAVTAYILNQAKIVPDDAVMNKETLPKVEMPNRNGFKDAGH